MILSSLKDLFEPFARYLVILIQKKYSFHDQAKQTTSYEVKFNEAASHFRKRRKLKCCTDVWGEESNGQAELLALSTKTKSLHNTLNQRKKPERLIHSKTFYEQIGPLTLNVRKLFMYDNSDCRFSFCLFFSFCW